jgi:hypothetical protein
MRIGFNFYITTGIFCHSLLLFATLHLAVFVAIFDILPSLLLFATLHLTVNFCCLRCYILPLIVVICDYTLRHSFVILCYVMLCHSSIWTPSSHYIHQINIDYRVRITQQYDYYIQYIFLKHIPPVWYDHHQLSLPVHKEIVCFLKRGLAFINSE